MATMATERTRSRVAGGSGVSRANDGGNERRGNAERRGDAGASGSQDAWTCGAEEGGGGKGVDADGGDGGKGGGAEARAGGKGTSGG